MEKYTEANNSMINRDQQVAASLKMLENEMNFIGVSGVEDKLQENVQLTIDSLKGAGIQVWMLTGDRVETGTSIAISAGLKSRQDELFFITEHVVEQEIHLKFVEFRKKAKKTILIIDGKTLDAIFDSDELVF
jgi:phospholipid-translocating ATPase